MRKKKTMLLVVLLMAVGFAAVSTTLYINGQTKINANHDDFNVYYSDAYVNGEQDKSVITDNTHISFTTELSTLGEKYVLDYEVTNGSKNYDAELVMECTEGNEYLTVTNEFDTTTNLEALKTRSGKLTLELKKSYAGDTDMDVTITCTIDANAIERDSLGEATPVGPIAFIPNYYAFGTPTTASTTDYTTLGKSVFVGLGEDNSLGVCINDNGLYCIKINDYANAAASMKEHFGEDNCTDGEYSLTCESDTFNCELYPEGGAYCSAKGDLTGSCGIDDFREVFCY